MARRRAYVPTPYRQIGGNQSGGWGDKPVDEYLLDAIGALPYKQRVVVVARYWAGFTEAETAEVLGCRPGTVKVTRIAGAQSPAQGGRRINNSHETLDDFEDRIRTALTWSPGSRSGSEWPVHPPWATSASLRADVQDAAGNTGRQTVTRAYLLR